MDNKNLYYIDIHNHYANYDFKDKMILKKNKIISLTASTDINDYKKLNELFKKDIPNLYFAYGLYPENVNNMFFEKVIKNLNKINFNNCIAIGEIGLDFKITENQALREKQIKLFKRQLNLARQLKKPVVVHSRYATKKVLDVLKEYKDLKVILHWFSGSEKEIIKALEMGFYLTIRYNSPKIKDVFKYLNQIFIETDYPVPYFDLETDILNIKESYKMFAKKNNIDLKELKEKIQTNFLKVFNIDVNKI